MRVVNVILSVLITVVSTAHGQARCRTESVNTSVGNLDHMTCRDATKKYTHSVLFKGDVVLRESFLASEDSNKTRTLWLFTGDSKMETGCPDRLYLIDLSMTPVKVIAFGVKKACNEFHWASWGEKRSVIALKHNVKFTYENGKITVPTAGEGLWKAIEPPHAGAGLAESDATAFAEDVPLPK